MPKVSRNQIDVRVYHKIFTLLPTLITASATPSKAGAFVNSLFSTSEKTMIAKRIAIILMLEKQQSYEQISTKLKVGHGTIAKMAEVITHADQLFLDEISKVAASDRASDFWNSLGYKLDTLLPPKGANWKSWRSRKIREKLEGTQPF